MWWSTYMLLKLKSTLPRNSKSNKRNPFLDLILPLKVTNTLRETPYSIEMKDDDSLPTTVPATNVKKENSDLSLSGKGRYKFWALAAILLLAFWSMFTGTVTLRWSAGNLNRLSEDIDIQIHDDLDVLEMEESEKMVKHMWDVYTNSRRIRLQKFWQEAFEAAYEELSSDVPEVREAAITEIAKMSVRSIGLEPPPVQSTSAREISKSLKQAGKDGGVASSTGSHR